MARRRNPSTTTFKQVRIGQRFKFPGESVWCEKVSPRGFYYTPARPGSTRHIVDTIHTPVIALARGEKARNPRGKKRNPHPPENWWWTMSSEEYGPEVFGPYDSYDDADDGITRVRKKVWALQDDIARWYSEPVSGPKPEAPFDTLGMDPFELEDDGRVPNPKRSNPSKAPLYRYHVTGPQGGKYLTSTMAEAHKLTKNGGTIKKLKKPRKG